VLPSEYEHRDDAGFRRRFDLGDAPLLLFIGRLSPIKGPDLLVEAFASVRERIPHVLVMAGPDVGMGRQLAQLVDQHSLGQRVRFIGHVSGALKSAAYHAAELLVIPSRREAMSLVVLEGGVTGTPFLATDQCGLEELARAGGGLTVPATAAGVAGGITTMLADPTALRTMGENLRIVTLRDATWQAAAARLRELFEDILARRATGR
jgi:glycosyltransferase involved in cell wall biosynthesis